ncbi:hypothetical protein BE61_18520 [Bradyrhizobium elkanii USDA 61]|nr:hypothetical protein BE61_18520 [Bradyrhizobium elkanii USDA 61]
MSRSSCRPAASRRRISLQSQKRWPQNPANKVSDVRRRTSGDAEILSLPVSDGGKTMHMRCIDAKGTRYTLTIEFPNAYRDLVAANKDRFCESFKLKTKS